MLLGIAHRELGKVEQELQTVGLSSTLYETLAQLARARGPLHLRVLAEGQHCAPSNITQKMDRLERDGLVQRIEDPSDRRAVLAEITPLGRERARMGEERMQRLAAAFEAQIPDPDLDALDRVLRALE